MIYIENKIVNELELNGYELAVMLHIVKVMNSETKIAITNRATLRKETGFSGDRILNAIDTLIHEKLITSTQVRQQGKFAHTEFTVIDNGFGFIE